MDALSHVLTTVRLEAGVFSRARLTAPWGVHSERLGHGLFHVVVRGAGEIRRPGAPTVRYRAGDLLVLPRGDEHVMASDSEASPRPLPALPSEPGEDGIPCVHHGGDGSETMLLCGTFRVHPAAQAFLTGRLPDLLHVQPKLDATATWLDASLRLLTAEQLERAPGSAALSARLAEMLFVQVLRAFARDRAEGAGWLGALFDPQLGGALAAVHADPTASWTVASLARRAGMSRSVFFERFKEVVGEAPTAYLTRWRMVVARIALAEGSSLAEAASRSGYGSEASFSRAFKRALGVAPGAWRASTCAA
ncbi:MAG: AraC family transcriptional regulator [Myxococcales bacterium]|nr:AraC family transcriptional regulator [Myxococcales bacterium]